MHKELIIRAFQKAEEELIKGGKHGPSLQAKAVIISDHILEAKNFRLNERSFRDYYNAAKQVISSEEDISINQQQVINGLCEYLGYANYQEFVSVVEQHESRNIKVGTEPVMAKGEDRPETMPRPSNHFSKNKSFYILGILLLIIMFLFIPYNHHRWMIWVKDRYVEVPFDSQQLSKGLLKIYKEDRINDFKSVIPNCETPFFNEDGTENLWYGKNKEGDLEYFSDLGQHPQTGKTVKKITVYMIKKYICSTYPN